jgi:hypothetical protein
VGVAAGAADAPGVIPHLLARYDSIWLLAVVTAGVLKGANTVVNWSIVVAACAEVLAWSYAVRKGWKAEAISFGAWLSRLSRAAAPLAMSCLNEVRFGVAPGVVGVNEVARLLNPATTTPAWVQKAELLLPTAGGGVGVGVDELPQPLSIKPAAIEANPPVETMGCRTGASLLFAALRTQCGVDGRSPRPINPRVEWVG